MKKEKKKKRKKNLEGRQEKRQQHGNRATTRPHCPSDNSLEK